MLLDLKNIIYICEMRKHLNIVCQTLILREQTEFDFQENFWFWLLLSNFWKLLNRNLTSFDNKSLNNFAFYIKYTRKLIRDHDDCSSICVLIWHFHKKMIFRFLPPSIPNAAVLQIETFCSIQTYLFITLKSGNFSTLHPALTWIKGCLEKWKWDLNVSYWRIYLLEMLVGKSFNWKDHRSLGKKIWLADSVTVMFRNFRNTWKFADGQSLREGVLGWRALWGRWLSGGGWQWRWTVWRRWLQQPDKVHWPDCSLWWIYQLLWVYSC